MGGWWLRGHALPCPCGRRYSLCNVHTPRVFVEQADCTGHLEITIWQMLYEHVSSLWYYEGWLLEDSVEYAAAHYAAYSIKRLDRLCFISLDTDMLPDTFSILSFLTDEPQATEDAGECAYQIVDHCSPHVITKIFYGHTHEYQLSIFYSNNATAMSAEAVQTVSWIAPSLTPLTNLHNGFRMYEVDSANFDTLNAYTYMATP
ncbi:hypothetical protein EV401DRAFT_1896208 [Pisolithus croceorrhizus]|nr:hypothetical protein EV401DRAFT_1896208 [Pisolithus croceorrhizus]